MNHDETFRMVMAVGAGIVFPIMAFFRIKSQATGEKLDRWQEGRFVLFTLRPAGMAGIFGLLAFLIDPSSMAWSSLPLPEWLRWTGIGLGAAAGMLLIWTMRTLGPNLTDTVVTRRNHTLVTRGPYQWVRHPFYVAVALAVLANGLAAANWFLLATGALVFALLIVRLPREEERLRARFGEAYRAYERRTGRFIPRLGNPPV